MPTFSQHHEQITKSFPYFTETIFKLLPSFKSIALISTVRSVLFGDQSKQSKQQNHMLILFIVFIRHLLSAQSFLLSPRIPSPTPNKSSPLLAIRHLSNMKECKTILTHQHCQPPYNLQCVSNHQHSWYHLSALPQFCKAVLVFHVYLEILVSYINHQFSFSAESGSRAFSTFLKMFKNLPCNFSYETFQRKLFLKDVIQFPPSYFFSFEQQNMETQIAC